MLTIQPDANLNANWYNFTDFESGILFYEYYVGPSCITAADYCGSEECVDVGGTCSNTPGCLNQTLATAFRATRGKPSSMQPYLFYIIHDRAWQRQPYTLIAQGQRPA